MDLKSVVFANKAMGPFLESHFQGLSLVLAAHPLSDKASMERQVLDDGIGSAIACYRKCETPLYHPPPPLHQPRPVVLPFTLPSSTNISAHSTPQKSRTRTRIDHLQVQFSGHAGFKCFLLDLLPLVDEAPTWSKTTPECAHRS